MVVRCTLPTASTSTPHTYDPGSSHLHLLPSFSAGGQVAKAVWHQLNSRSGHWLPERIRLAHDPEKGTSSLVVSHIHTHMVAPVGAAGNPK